MRLLPKRIEDLLSRVRRTQADKHLAARSGVRRISAKTDAGFDAEVARIMAEQPGNYLFVPEPENFDEWILRRTGKTVAEHEEEWRRSHEDQHRPDDSGPMK